jgi:hypothetical protein
VRRMTMMGKGMAAAAAAAAAENGTGTETIIQSQTQALVFDRQLKTRQRNRAASMVRVTVFLRPLSSPPPPYLL